MIVNFIGVSRRSGTSKKTGAPYDMCTLQFAVPIQEVNTANMNYTGYGFETKEIEVMPEAIQAFYGQSAFSQVDVIIEPKPTNFNHTWVVGVKEPVSTRKAS